jgi:uncharacterized tellurite resistance protein B-like protein
MHIIIGLLTALATLLYALERLGVDLGWFNPWAWKRRRAWLKQSTGNPAYGLDRPIDAIALIAIAAAKIDGDLSIEEKDALNKIFKDTFNMSEKDASQLIVASVYLLGSGEDVFSHPEKVLRLSLEKFSKEQKQSSLELLSSIIHVGGSPSQLQMDFFSRVKCAINPPGDTKSW